MLICYSLPYRTTTTKRVYPTRRRNSFVASQNNSTTNSMMMRRRKEEEETGADHKVGLTRPLMICKFSSRSRDQKQHWKKN
jgi:hypothetical protein